MILSAVLIVGLLRIILIGFTLGYQCKGRDYEDFNNRIERLIPEGAYVVGPQLVWYALAERASSLRLYTAQMGGGHLRERVGEAFLNDPETLKPVTHIVIQEEIENGRAFPGLHQYTKSNFTLLENIKMPFKPLPWAKNSPLDVYVYARSVRNK